MRHSTIYSCQNHTSLPGICQPPVKEHLLRHNWGEESQKTTLSCGAASSLADYREQPGSFGLTGLSPHRYNSGKISERPLLSVFFNPFIYIRLLPVQNNHSPARPNFIYFTKKAIVYFLFPSYNRTIYLLEREEKK
jgi:hypothetical protein